MEDSKINNDKLKLFYENTNKFCSQAIGGIYMALYRNMNSSGEDRKFLPIVNDTKLIFKLLTIYLNNCWKSYHIKSDEFVVGSINSIKNVGILKHDSCIFDIIMEICNVQHDYIKNQFQTYEYIDKIIMSKNSIDGVRDCIMQMLNNWSISITNELIKL